jgi:folylpolyglutamate synthase/dihydrofolate synthase
MSARWLPADAPFFAEYNARLPGEVRSLARARELQALWGLEHPDAPILTVVGSKGKGTAATFAAATLSAHGLRTGLVTSPPLRTNRERVRIDGLALDEESYERMSDRLSVALDALGPRTDGYLAPGGAYTVAALAELTSRDCDVVVLEEGLGGASDEVSLFAPIVVAVTPIFSEHADLLGPTISDIADDLLGVIGPDTAAVVSAAQDPSLTASFAEAAERASVSIAWCTEGHDRHLGAARGLSQANARVGIEAAMALLALRQVPAAPSLALLESVHLPGRLSHVVRGATHWVVDSAIEAHGAAAALDWCQSHVGDPDLVLLGMPDIKDVGGTLAVFGGHRVVGAEAGQTHLTYQSEEWTDISRVSWEEAVRLADQESAAIVLCVGTISFVGEMLEHLDVDCDRVYGDATHSARTPR